MTIAVDFDGVLCQNKWPEIGYPNTRLMDKLIQLQGDGHIIILWTCRVGELLDNAVDFCTEHGLILDYVNRNTDENIEMYGGDSRKVHADFYIDDHNVSDIFNQKFMVPFSWHKERQTELIMNT